MHKSVTVDGVETGLIVEPYPPHGGMPEPVYAQVVEALKSPHFHTENIHGDDLQQILDQLIEYGTVLDGIKKVLFYGRKPGQPAPTFVSPFSYEKIHPDIVHGLIGIITEATELAERLLKMGHDPEGEHRTNLIEELGDLDWYAQLVRNRLNITSEEVRAVNARKLFRRYPEKVFAATRAAERNLAAEHEALTNVSGD